MPRKTISDIEGNNYATANPEILAAALAEVRQHLGNFALNSDFLSQMQLAYGDNFDAAVALDLAQAWQNRDFSIVPTIEFLNSAELNGANGAYAAANDTIYVSQEFISQNQTNLAALINLLLEEIGHRIDSLLNTTDSAGDEGAIFAEIVMGGVESLTEEQLQALKAENDSGLIAVNGQVIAVEMQDFTGTSGNDTINGTNNYDFIDALAGNDSLNGSGGNDEIYGGEGNDTINGGAGDDYIETGTGNDSVNGGAGYDTVYIYRSGETSNITISSTNLQQVEYLEVYTGSGNDTIDASTALDRASVGAGAGNDSITGTNGIDYLDGGDGNDTINGGAGDDDIRIDTGNDSVDGGAGYDTVYIGIAGLRYDIHKMRSLTVKSSQRKCNVLNASRTRFKKMAGKEENKIISVLNVVVNLLQNIINIKATVTNLNVNV